VWSTAGGRPRVLKGHSGAIRSLAFSPDGKMLAVGTYKQVQLWDVATGKEEPTLEGHTDQVTGVKFYLGGKALVTASKNEALIWKPPWGKDPVTLKGGGWRSFPDGKTLARCAFAMSGSRLYLWDVATGEPRKTINLGLTPFLGTLIAAGSADGRRAVVGGGESVRVWDAVTGESLGSHSLHTAAVVSVDLAPDGKTVVSGSRDGTAILWDVASGKMRARLKGHKGSVRAAFLRAGKMVVTWSPEDDTVRLWDVGTGKERAHFREKARVKKAGVKFAVVSPDGKTLATTTHDGAVRLWGIDAALAGPR
jgi:WD40 repeat protein